MACRLVNKVIAPIVESLKDKLALWQIALVASAGVVLVPLVFGELRCTLRGGGGALPVVALPLPSLGRETVLASMRATIHSEGGDGRGSSSRPAPATETPYPRACWNPCLRPYIP
jgi:hypothetical protein